MSYYYDNGNGSPYRRSRYFDTTYDRNSPYEQIKRDRQRINIMIPGLDNSGLDPNLKSCKWCHEVLILVDDGLNLFCQGCGMRTPTTSTSTPSNDKDKPTLPKESKSSKLKQKNSLENRPFIVTQQDRLRNPKSESEESEEDLSALNYFSRLYGNVGGY